MNAVVRRGVVIVLITTVLVPVWSTVAGAHARVVTTDPLDGASVATSPARVSVTFTEAVDPSLGGLSVRDASGQAVDEETELFDPTTLTLSVGLRANLPEGTYVATYRVRSPDGHPVSGAFVFGVGVDADTSVAPGESSDRIWDAAAAASRAALSLFALVAAGVGLFGLVLIGPTTDRTHRTLTRLLRTTTMLTLVSAVAIIATQSALLTGRGLRSLTDPGVVRDVLGARLGWSLTVVLVAMALLRFATDRVTAVRSDPIRSGPIRPGVTEMAMAVGFALTAVSFAIWGHQAESPWPVLALASNVVHVAAASLWLGGITVLVILLRRQDPVAIGAVDRFSSTAIVSVVALVIAGLLMTVIGSGASGTAIVGTTWGLLLLAKVVLVVVVLLLAVWNRRRLVPRLRDAGPALVRLRRVMTLEGVMMVVILGVTGVLVGVTPARTAAPGPIVSVTTVVDSGTVEVSVDPGRAGRNTLRVEYRDDGGEPVDVATSMTAEFSLPALQIGPLTEQLFKIGPGRYATDTDLLSLAGDWSVTLLLRTGDFRIQRTPLELTIR